MPKFRIRIGYVDEKHPLGRIDGTIWLDVAANGPSEAQEIALDRFSERVPAHEVWIADVQPLSDLPCDINWDVCWTCFRFRPVCCDDSFEKPGGPGLHKDPMCNECCGLHIHFFPPSREDTLKALAAWKKRVLK